MDSRRRVKTVYNGRWTPLPNGAVLQARLLEKQNRYQYRTVCLRKALSLSRRDASNCHGIPCVMVSPFPSVVEEALLLRGRGILARSLRAHLSGAFEANDNNTFPLGE